MKRKNGWWLGGGVSRLYVMFVLSIALPFICEGSAAAPRLGGHSEGQSVVVISGNEDLRIPDDQIRSLQEEALSGSGETAHRLASFYFYVKLDKMSGMRWATIAAENGFPLAMSSLGARLMIDQKNPDSAIRAKFWLERARSAGEPTAQSLLDELHQQHPSR